MKKIVLGLIAATMLVALLCSCGSSGATTLRVYNWQEYMDPEVIEMFTEETGIEVLYNVFDTNENMYNKIKNMKGYSYDVVFPSDYMVKKMADEGMLAEINFDNIPNYKYIDSKYKGMAYDKKNLFSVPYIGGTVCIAYNPDYVDENEVKSWDVLWNEKYAGNIFMMDSERDSIAVALLRLGYSINTKNMDELNEAKDLLIQQKPLVLAYTSDDVKEKMAKEEGWLAVMWSCDITFIRDLNEKIQFVIPEEGTNTWWDTVCILENAEHKEEAEKFIDFLCRPDIALMNAEYLESSTPNTAAYEELDEEIKNDPVIYPSEDVLAKCEVFDDLADYMSTYTSIWNAVVNS
ncbi:MAG: spermidine/putrescine ABC transporter substrate-binding protein [Clostridia bacterium]|nr:spermidine/putrescine ABC transporter substrate-binding protein [Clostridia bacterium]